MKMPKTAALLALALLPACGWARGPEPAEMVLKHGKIYTMTAPGKAVQAVAIAGGKIVYAGDDRTAARYVGDDTRQLDLAGRTVLPGFQDGHVHLVESGMEARNCQIVDQPTAKAVFARIKGFAASHPKAPWVRGSGWELPTFPNANPRKEWLDKLVPNRPAYIAAADGHSAWVNSRALAAAHITRRTPDPEGGRIERDPRTGEPSGTLRESAMRLMTRVLPPTPRAERMAALDDALKAAARFGITSAYEANEDAEMLQTLQDADLHHRLTVRVVAALSTNPQQGVSQVPGLIAMRARYASPMLEPTAVKLFIDGVMESHTAAMLAPYLDGKTGRPTAETGLAFWRNDRLLPTVKALDKAGFQIHMHAIGDRAVRQGLDAVAAMRRANGMDDTRPTIAHLQLVDPADLPRFKALGVIANLEPFWFIRDAYIRDLTEPVLGPERSARLYPYGDLVRAGARTDCGSDWSVTSLNPLDAVQVAVTRRDVDGPPGEPWLPAQVVDRFTVLSGYTRGAAYAMHHEALTGTLEVGKAADLVVLDGDPFTVPAETIHTLRPQLTLLGGRAVYRVPEATDLEAAPAW